MHGYLAHPKNTNTVAVRNVRVLKARTSWLLFLWALVVQAFLFRFLPEGMGATYEGWMFVAALVLIILGTGQIFLVLRAWRAVRSDVNVRATVYVTWSTIREFKQALKEADTRPNGKLMREEYFNAQARFDDEDKRTRKIWREDFVPRYARRRIPIS